MQGYSSNHSDLSGPYRDRLQGFPSVPWATDICNTLDTTCVVTRVLLLQYLSKKVYMQHPLDNTHVAFTEFGSSVVSATPPVKPGMIAPIARNIP